MSDTVHNHASTALIRQRIKAAIDYLFIGDSLSMPVHWFYNPGDIIRTFPPHGIQRLEAAPSHHPSSIMSLHSTSQGGRSARRHSRRTHRTARREIVGDVILKGKRHLWGQANAHYHHGMRAGDNTLNAWWAMELLDWLSEHPDYCAERWVERYIDFMTADPAQHPDTYAESCHRGFFANWAGGVSPQECGAITHDTPSMGALVTVAPLALALLATHPLQEVQIKCRSHVWLTHPDQGLMQVIDAYVVLISKLLHANKHADTTPYFIEAAAAIPGTRLDKLLEQDKGDAHVLGRTYSLACYITDSWPSVCYLAAKYSGTPTQALLRNTNLGGENAHRGSVLGTLVGLASSSRDTTLLEQLSLHQRIDKTLNRYLDLYYPLTETSDSFQ